MTAPRILLVDDSAPVRDMLSVMLGRLGYAVTAAAGPSTAFEEAHRGRFDLAILDLRLADHNGADLAADLRSLGGVWTDLPMLAITADPAERDDPVPTPFDALLGKPIDPAGLVRTVQRLLETSAQAGSSAA
jgi:CheY-like chemotaxis protein